MSQIRILLLTHLKTHLPWMGHMCSYSIGVVIPCSNAAFFLANFLKIIFGPRNVHGKGHFHLRSAAFVYVAPLFSTYLYVIIHVLLCGQT